MPKKKFRVLLQGLLEQNAAVNGGLDSGNNVQSHKEAKGQRRGFNGACSRCRYIQASQGSRTSVQLPFRRTS